MTAQTPAIELTDVSVNFGGVRAVREVSLNARAGATTAIIGPNGAGKTTLFNCISGFVKPTAESRIAMNGVDISGLRVDQRAQLGLARTFQNISLNRTLTTRDNILSGLHLALPYGPLAALLPGRRVREAETDACGRIARVADTLRISTKTLDARVDTLSLGLQKKIEIARALVGAPKVLLLDEPAGGLNDGETRELAESLRVIARSDLDVSILLIDHDMSFVMPLSEKVYVLNFGTLVAGGPPTEIMSHPDVIACYLGDENVA